jgi:hypothetical protein
MLTREQLLEVGVGSLEEVSRYHCEQQDAGGVIDPTLSTLAVAIRNVPATKENLRAVSAMLCALANRQLEETGYLYSLEKSGNVSRSYLSVGAERSIIAAAVTQ